jgi:hypothetical protein
MRRFLHLGLACLLLSGGCRTKPRSPTEEQFNQHWRDGGGFNNPNVERKKKGLPPLNFDGSDPRDDWMPEFEVDLGIGTWLEKRIDRGLRKLPTVGPIETAGPPEPIPGKPLPESDR